MKRYLHLLLTLLLLSVCTVGGAQTTYTHTFAPKQVTMAAGDATWDNVTWSWTKPNNVGFDTTRGVQIGSKNNPQAKGWTISTDGIKGTITSVKVNAAIAKDGSATLAVKVGSTDFLNNAKTSASLATTSKDYEFTGSATGTIAITMKASSKAMYIKKITVTYSNSNKKSADISFPASSYKMTLGETFTAPTLTNPNNLTITYASTAPQVATVDASTGVVNPINYGTTTITASSDETDTYTAGSASYTLTIMPKLTGDGTEANPYTVADVIALNTANALPQDQVFVKGIITKIDEVSTQHKNATYNISDNSQATNQLKIYRGKNLNNTDFTAAADLSTGWTVTVKGVLTLYNNSTLEMTTGNYITSIVKPSEYTPATLTSFAQSGKNYYATFSSDQVTFFPESDENTSFMTDVQKAYAFGDMLELTNLTTATATIDGNEVSGYYVPANTGVLIKASFDNASSITYYTVSGKDVDLLTDNMLYPATKKMSELNNCYFYKLAYDDYSSKTGLGFYWGADNGTVFTAKTNGAYLAVPKTASAKSAFRFDGTTTGVNTINAKTTTNDVIYNIQGQRVGANYKGLVIVNGKKMMRK